MTSSDSGDHRPGQRPSPPDPSSATGPSSWFDEVFGQPGSAGTAEQGSKSDPGEDRSGTGFGPAGHFSGPPPDQPFGPYASPGFDQSAEQYGSEPTAPLFPIGAISEPYQGHQPMSWPPPVQPVPASRVQAGRRQRTGPGSATVVAVAALTALVVGATAGYGGTRFAAWQAAGGATRMAGSPSSGTAPSGTAPSGTAPSGTAPSTRAPSGPLSPGSGTVAIARQVLPSTVTIRVGASGATGGTGSGLVLDRSGRILTNNHVVEAAGDGGRLQVVFADGTTLIGELVGRSPSYDLAVVQVSASQSLVPVQLGDSDATQVGEPAIAVGAPLGLGGTVTAGIISAKDRPVAVSESSDTDAPSAYIDALQTDAPINPGNSGGPLVNSAGQVIGVNSAILTLGDSTQGQSGSIGLGFAIPIKQARQIAQELISDGHATYPVIGAGAVDAGSSLATGDGVLLQDVQPGEPAAQAGLQAGDVVTSIDGRPVAVAKELIVAIRGHRPGDTVTLSYQRGGLTQQARVLLGSREG